MFFNTEKKNKQIYAFFFLIVDISLYLCAEISPPSSFRMVEMTTWEGGYGTQMSLNASAIWILWIVEKQIFVTAYKDAVSPSFCLHGIVKRT